MLDEFSATQIDPKTPAPDVSGPGRPAPTTAAGSGPGAASATTKAPGGGEVPSADQSRIPVAGTGAPGGDDEDFTSQLQAGMADLLGELEGSPEMQKQLEDLVREFGAATTGPAPAGGQQPAASTGLDANPASASASTATKSAEESFQETIQRTMERMQASGNQASVAAASTAGDDDILAQMLREMEKGGAGGGEGDEDFSKMLLGMMDQLTNKEILYEPMKDLNDKFPGWMEANGAKLAAEERDNYAEQMRLIREIVVKFEAKDYSDSNPADREYIVDRMQKVR